jgi:hypothetical protein
MILNEYRGYCASFGVEDLNKKGAQRRGISPPPDFV